MSERDTNNLSINTTAHNSNQTYQLNPNSSKNSNPKKMDMPSKETLGLPIFVSGNGETITNTHLAQPTSNNSTLPFTSSAPSSSTVSYTAPTRRESILSPKRLSMAFDFAVTSLDSIYKQAQTLLNEEAPPRNTAPRTDDLESGGAGYGGQERRFGDEEAYKDWLD